MTQPNNPNNNSTTSTKRTAEELTDLYGAEREPKKLKKEEAPIIGRETPTDAVDLQHPSDASRPNPYVPVHLNSGFVDLTDPDTKFQPDPGQDARYLWTVREDGHLILGVEEPSKMPGAFAEDPSKMTPTGPQHAQNVKDSLQAVEGLGHPTLAVEFEPGGETRLGKARISGELFKDNATGEWAINDHSGRYSNGRMGTDQLLVNAADLFQKNGVDVRHIQTKQSGDKVVSIDDWKAQHPAPEVSGGIQKVADQVAAISDPQPIQPNPNITGIAITPNSGPTISSTSTQLTTPTITSTTQQAAQPGGPH